MLGSKERRALKPDAQGFDEVRIFTKPRYKTSGMSGDEWRISATLQLLRKGQVVHEAGYRNVEMACVFAAAEYYRAQDDGKAYFAGEGDICDQEGCKDTATVNYRVLAEFCRDHPHEHKHELKDEVVIRKFCARHSRRGDAAFDDADNNYELLSGTAENPRTEDVREAGRVTVKVNSLDELPQKIAEVHQSLKRPSEEQ